MNSWHQRIRKASVVDKQAQIVALCKGKKVLDVGCVGQDLDPDSPRWLHARIREVAASVTGCDINTEGIQRLNERGLQILTPEQVEASNEKYDVVVMGDVIEHVTNAGEFLEYYKRFLQQGGTMIICTPNAFGIRYVLQVFFYGRPTTNPEHTVYFDPFVMLELINRVGLKPADFYWLYDYQKPGKFSQYVIAGMSWVMIKMRRFFHANFMMIVQSTDAE